MLFVVQSNRNHQKLYLQSMNTQNTEYRQEVQTHIKRSILFANNNLTYIQLGQIQKSIAELLQQNKKKYNKIVGHKPDFSYQLYKIGEFQANSKAFGKELLLRQLDRLLEEKNYLDRELSIIKFENQEQKDQKEKMINDEKNHFQLLKSIWIKDRTNKYEGSIEHVEELNLMVAQIKSNIHSLIKFEANEHKDFEEAYLNTFQQFHDKNKQCRKCGQLKAKNENLVKRLEEIEEKMSKISDQNIEYLEQINKRDEKLKKATKAQIKQQTQLKDKIIRLQQQILKRDHTIKQMKKEIADFENNKLINEQEGFQIYFKGIEVDLSKYKTKINVSFNKIMSFLSQQLETEMKIVAQEIKRSSVRSKCDSTEDSRKSNREITGEEHYPTIIVSKISEKCNLITEKQGNEIVQKKKTFESGQLKTKLEDLQATSKRYIRTSSKRNNRQNSNLHNDENQQSISCRIRGASPNYVSNLQ